MVLSRDQVKRPVLPKETVTVEALGGDVIVRGMLASERLALASMALKRDAMATAAAASAASPAIDPDQASERQAEPTADPDEADFGGSFVRIPLVLSRVVLLADGKPLYSEEEWQVFGGQHPDAVLELFAKAKKLSGIDLEEVRKNS